MTVFEIIEKHCNSTNNKSGVSVPKLIELTGIDWFDLRKELNSLHSDKKIIVRQGVNGKLIFLNSK